MEGGRPFVTGMGPPKIEQHSGPLAPFGDWPIQFFEPEIAYAWYTHGATFVTQALIVSTNVYVVSILNDWLDDVTRTHREEIERAGGLLAIHDWRRIRKYDSASREAWFARMRARPSNYLRKAIVVVGDAPLLKMALAGANLLTALHLKSQVQIASNCYQVLREHGVIRPGEPAT